MGSQNSATRSPRRSAKSKLKKFGKMAGKVADKATMAADLQQSVNDMYSEISDIVELAKTQDVFAKYAGSYAAEAAAAALGGNKSEKYTALTIFFMAEYGYIIAKEAVANNADLAMSLADPTGIVDTYQAFDAGLCTRNKPFPL